MSNIIKKKMDWIRSIRPGETKIGYFSSRGELDCVSTLVSRYNQSEGCEKGMIISGKRNWVEISYTLTCNIIEDSNEQQNEE